MGRRGRPLGVGLSLWLSTLLFMLAGGLILSRSALQISFKSLEILGKPLTLPGTSQTATNNTYVVLSTGCAPLYSFFLPIAALVWSRRLQFQPIILLVHDVPVTKTWGSDKQTAVILHWLKQWGFADSIYYIDYNSTLPDNNVAISQMSRMFVSGMCGLTGPVQSAIDEDAFIVTTDVDIIPTAEASFWLPNNQSKMYGKVTNSHCCGHQTVHEVKFREFPMSTMAFRASTWRRFMQYRCICNGAEDCHRGSLVASINKVLQDTFLYGTPRQSPTQWNMDQRLVSLMLHKCQAVLNATELLSRDTLHDRIDRLSWPQTSWSDAVLAHYNDAHMLRPGHTPDNWVKLRPFIRAVLRISETPDDTKLWQEMEMYAAQYSSAVVTNPAQYMLISEKKKVD